ncbi:uncharacterized protein SPPG_01471 [Spizellomyces punctatus DAOM BR117]|uniref:Uncharacterized protein n=1 Tax=Spizellomyces punctatus (strain DAOM BR117) TaxID=645134 RepID=A0A0L0HT21_SPIPD|nr:uncharacterized protein SPPG_01471 [Spizellomyces punctatus DAOM BR117]KND04024.1 hypothetical protein SPPG_01471 [Spizellomyces punctatus DAOM BR117]|eukprot:XP_016612063.1 hypothetical protein SPPG_01471 [Spizellomyces punctatus DAOM BR117]
MDSSTPCELQFLVTNCRDERAMFPIIAISFAFYIMQLGLLGYLIWAHLKELSPPFRVFAVGWTTHTVSRLVYLPLLISGTPFGAHMSEMADLGCVTALCVIVEYVSAVSKALPLSDFVMPRRWQLAVETFRKGWVRVVLFLVLFTPNTVLAIISGLTDDPYKYQDRMGGVFWARITKANYLVSLTITFVVTVVISLATYSIIKEAQSKSHHDPARFGKLATLIWMVLWFSAVSAFLVFAFIVLIAIYAFVDFRNNLAGMVIMGIFWHIFLPLFYNFAFLAAIAYYHSDRLRELVFRVSAKDGTVASRTGKTSGKKHGDTGRNTGPTEGTSLAGPTVESTAGVSASKLVYVPGTGVYLPSKSPLVTYANP